MGRGTNDKRYKTPLRYPGGKQKLAPYVAEVMQHNDLGGGEYVEPYAGGAGVAIELLLTGVASRVHLNDASWEIYAFWRSILNRTERFCQEVLRVPLTIGEWRKQRDILRNPGRHNQFEVGFSLFYQNRCNRSGIPTGGAIGGIAQDGRWKIDARFPRQELVDRIHAIAAKRSLIEVTNLDAETYLTTNLKRLPRKTLVYCDPPYFHKADRLYLNHYLPADHQRIAQVIQNTVRHPWLVSYDNAPEIKEHYVARRSFVYALQYNAGEARKGCEVFFCSDDIHMPARSKVKCIDLALQAMAH